MNSLMTINDLHATINTPEALKGGLVHALPPYAPQPAYVVDDYPECPTNWMHGSKKASSYFVPVEEGKGLWFDFTRNASHKHDVAIVVSVQGVNPITGVIEKGKPCSMFLEQYRDKCPKHNVDFEKDRFCPKCEYRWPAQNYIASTTGMRMWIDGFRNEQGQVRQYLITADDTRGVAAQLLGENRVWAIGFAFFLSKKPKPVQTYTDLYGSGGLVQPWIGGWYGNVHNPPNKKYFTDPGHYGEPWNQVTHNMLYDPNAEPKMTCSSEEPTSGSINMCAFGDSDEVGAAFAMPPKPALSPRGGSSRSLRAASAAPVKQLEIAAGAAIEQDAGVDPNPISYWKSKPSGLIYVNYVSTMDAERIIKAGTRQDLKDGAFNGLKVGN